MAIVIGQNAPNTPKLPTLEFADDDAVQYTRLFELMGVETTLLTVMDPPTARRHGALAGRAEPPTLKGVRRAFAHANQRIKQAHAEGRRADLLLVYAGHGERGKRGQGRLHLQGDSLSRKQLVKLLRDSEADFNHVIIDACHAASVVFRRGGDGFSDREFGRTVQRYLDRDDLSALPNTGVVLAASSSEETHEWSAVQAGVFSHVVRSGLAGAADVNQDGLVEYTELAAHVAAASANIQVAGARPSVRVQAPRLNRHRPLMDLITPNAAYLRLPAGWTKHAWLEDDTGARHADVHPAGDVPVLIALAPQRRWYLRTQTQEAPLRLMRGHVTPAPDHWQPASTRARGAVREAYRAALFTEPFGGAFYRGYLAQSHGVSARLQRPVPQLPTLHQPTDLRPYTWTTGGLAIGTGLAALTTGVLAQRSYDDFDANLSRTGQDDPATRAHINQLRNWSNGLLVASALTSAAAITLFMFDTDFDLGLNAGPGTMGIEGRF